MQHNYSQEKTQGKPNKQMHRKNNHKSNKKNTDATQLFTGKTQGKPTNQMKNTRADNQPTK